MKLLKLKTAKNFFDKINDKIKWDLILKLLQI